MHRVLIQRAKEYIGMKEGLASRIRESLVSTPTRPEDLHDVESTESTRPSERVDTNDSLHGDDTTAADNNDKAETLTFRQRMDKRVAESDEPDGLEYASKIAAVYRKTQRSDPEASREAQKQVFGEIRFEPTEDLAELAAAQANGQAIDRLDQSTGETVESSIPADESSPESTTSPKPTITGDSTPSDRESVNSSYSGGDTASSTGSGRDETKRTPEAIDHLCEDTDFPDDEHESRKQTEESTTDDDDDHSSDYSAWI